MQETWKEYCLEENNKSGLRHHLVRLKVFRPVEIEGRVGLEEWCFYQVSGNGKAGLGRATRELKVQDWVFRITCGSKTGFYYDMECKAGYFEGITKFRSFHQAEQRALTLAKKHLLTKEGTGCREEKQLAVAKRVQRFR